MRILETRVDELNLDSSISWKKFDKKNILITGAAGLYGTATALTLLRNKRISTKLILQSRSANSLEEKYSGYENVICINNLDEICDIQIDYIFHFASPTSSCNFTNKPVETLKDIVDLTFNILDFATKKRAKIIYVSSVEIYGQLNKEFIREDETGILDLKNIRSSYPEGKRVSELLCHSFRHEYGLDVKIARPTLTFGPGVSKNDNRVFAQFAKSAINKEPIVLHTDGTTCRDYIHTVDAVKALFFIMLSDSDEVVFNISNTNTYSSIRRLAEIFSDISNMPILIDESKNKNQYAPKIKMSMDTSNLSSLGWKPSYNLKDMVIDLMNEMNGF